MALLIGAHVSIAGGVAQAPQREAEIGGNCGQIFTHSPRMWDSPRFTDADAADFRQKWADLVKGPVISHATYLVNLGSSNPKLWNGSVDMMKKELAAAESLGLLGVCVHAGSSADGVDAGLNNIVRALNALAGVSKHAHVLLENTAGGGLGTCASFENLKFIVDNTKLKTIGIVLDTCHAFAAGYDISSKDGLEKIIKNIDETVGIERLRAVHLNDSKGDIGKHLDRHEHIGMGKIGNEAMKRVLTHPKLRKLPFILETPEDANGDHLKNIAHVKKLVG